MVFFKKKKQSRSTTDRNSSAFENAFEKRLGQDPASYIESKLAGGSDAVAIRQLFDILATEVELRGRCKSPGFDFYYEKVLSRQITKVEAKQVQQVKITKDFAVSQLIGKQRFVIQYGDILKSLAGSQDFLQFVKALQNDLAGMEITNTRNANKRIADYFFSNNANEKFPQVKMIVEQVLTYGKRASAHISIYYAMFLFE